MELLRYRSTSAFWVFVHASGIPFVQLNGRRIMFHGAALEAWLRRRAVGKHAKSIIGSSPGDLGGDSR